MLSHDQILVILIMLAYLAGGATAVGAIGLLVYLHDIRKSQKAIDMARHPSARNLDSIEDPIDQAVRLGNL